VIVVNIAPFKITCYCVPSSSLTEEDRRYLLQPVDCYDFWSTVKGGPPQLGTEIPLGYPAAAIGEQRELTLCAHQF
jgi:hypothetical protein